MTEQQKLFQKRIAAGRKVDRLFTAYRKARTTDERLAIDAELKRAEATYNALGSKLLGEG